MHSTIKRKDSGMVSIFIVIFSALLITIVAVAFIRVMIQEQDRATTNDLSKSALDSAYAGVEDAKRALVQYKKNCGEEASTSECVRLLNAFNASECNTLQRIGTVSGKPGDKEVQVQQHPDDTKLDQAYTCVKIALDTDDYVGSITPDTSRLIHLKSEEAFSKITVEWYSQKDLQESLGGSATGTIDLYSGAQIPPPLPKLSDWPQNRPALLRLQLLQVGESFRLSDFNKNDDQNRSNASLFLYPASFGDTETSFSSDTRLSSTTSSFRVVSCNPNFSSAGDESNYACKLTITIPNPVGANDDSRRDVYLRVSELYNISTSFRVTMQDDSANTVKFKAVQPAVDSTGRANDLFRRINSRVDLEGSSIPNLEAAVDIRGSLCKTFLVTDSAEDYYSGACQDVSATAP